MTLELIAVEGCTIAHDSGSGISGGTFTITSVASTRVKGQGFGVYTVTIDFTFAGGNEATVTPGTVVGSGSVSSTAIKTKAEGLIVMREGDTGTLSGTGTNPAAPPPTLPVSGPVIIAAAGQSKARAE